MDFMRVFDQTLREIKREVNLRVLKVPEIEQKVLDATSDEPWGPHGSALAEIAQETKKIAERQMIMNVLWERLSETGSNWRHVYKALTVIEYLLANGSERTVDDIIEHSFQISSLSVFQYVEHNGKDIGINVRKKVETLLTLINDTGRIKRVREKAAATRNKYFGVSSNGITYKSGSALTSSSSNLGYGGFGSSKSQGSLANTYKELNKSTKGITRRCSSSKPSYHLSSTTLENDDDDLDDFDPRAGSGTAPVNVKQVNLLDDSMVVGGESLEAPVSRPLELALSTYGSTSTTEIDLFADVDGAVSVESNSHLQDNYGGDLFGNNQSASFPAQMDLLDTQMCQTNICFDLFSSKHDSEMDRIDTDLVKSDNLDPFATKSYFDPFGSLEPPLQARTQSESDMIDNFDLFGDAKHHQLDSFDNDLAIVPLNASKQQPDLLSTILISNVKLETSPNSGNNSNGDLNQRSKDNNNFQIKSGIWADSLSRGLIDLNITTPVESTLVDIGIMSGLGGGGGDGSKSNDKDKGIPSLALQMGRAMGTGTGLGISSLSSMGGATEGEISSSNITGSFFK